MNRLIGDTKKGLFKISSSTYKQYIQHLLYENTCCYSYIFNYLSCYLSHFESIALLNEEATQEEWGNWSHFMHCQMPKNLNTAVEFSFSFNLLHNQNSRMELPHLDGSSYISQLNLNVYRFVSLMDLDPNKLIISYYIIIKWECLHLSDCSTFSIAHQF